jgi:hypothetical protein
MRKTILIGLLTGALALAMVTSIGISNLGTVDAQCADPHVMVGDKQQKIR